VKLAIVCDQELKDAFLSKKITGNAEPFFISGLQHIPADAAVIIDLLFEYSPERISLLKEFLPRPVFINSVDHTLAGIGQPFIRVNAWPTFFTREICELAVLSPQQALMEDILGKIGWPYIIAPDAVGFISARIVAAIINEAYHTLEEKVSSRQEIDTAMKAGTHYPFGPFEWSRLIGLKKIYDLLHLLHDEKDGSEISALLKQEALLEEIKKRQV
jgi:3-hydroxybutyryl-CoA dehydrogenase